MARKSKLETRIEKDIKILQDAIPPLIRQRDEMEATIIGKKHDLGMLQDLLEHAKGEGG